MNYITIILTDGTAPYAIALVLALMLLSLAAVAWKHRVLKASMLRLSTEFADRVERWGGEASDSQGGHADRMWAALSRTFVFKDGAGVIVVREPPLEVLRQYVKAHSRRGVAGAIARGVGENLTAIALITTFALLGIVLIGPIFEALSLGDAGTPALRDAIRKMGAKFFVSAAGLIGSVIFQFVSRFSQERLEMFAGREFARFRTMFEELVTFHAKAADRSANGVATLNAQIVTSTRELADQLQKLENIEVSVQGLGNDVAANIGTIMKQSVADRICDAVTEMQEKAAVIADGMQAQIANAFTSSLKEELGKVESGIGTVRAAIEGHGESNVEQILEKMQDVLSGGFRTQSADMGRQLGEFVSVLPRLQEQFAGLAETLGSNAKRWGESNHQAVEQLSARIGDLLTQFEAAKTGMSNSVERLSAASSEVAGRVSSSAADQIAQLTKSLTANADTWAQHNQNMLAQISTRVDGLVERFDSVRMSMDTSVAQLASTARNSAAEVSDAARSQAQVLGEQLAVARKAAAEDSAAFHSRAEAFTQLMAKTQAELLTVTQALGGTTAKVVDVLRQAATVQSHSQSAATQFSAAATSIAEGAQRMDAIVNRQKDFLAKEEGLLEAQRLAVDSVERVLSGVLKHYEQSISTQAKQLADGWRALTEDTRKVINGSTGDLSESIEDLGASVKSLEKTLQSLPRAVR